MNHVVGETQRRERLASVEALPAGHESRVVVGVLRHDAVRVRHAGRRVEGIITNLRNVAEGVFHAKTKV